MYYKFIRNILLLISTIQVLCSDTTVAMEKDKDKAPRGPSLLSRDGQPARDTTQDQPFATSVKVMEQTCMELISQGAKVETKVQQLPFFLRCLNQLLICVASYKKHSEKIDFANEIKALTVQSFYIIETSLYDYWVLNMGAQNKYQLDSFFQLLSSLVSIDNFIFAHFHILSAEQIPNINIPLATHNFLSHVCSLFHNFNDRLITPGQRRTLKGFATTYFNFLRDHADLSADAHEYFELIQKKEAEWELTQRNHKFVSTAISAKQKQNQQRLQRECLELIQKNQRRNEHTVSQSLTVLYSQIIALKNIASAEMVAHRNLKRYLDSQRETYSQLLQLESQIAKLLDINPSGTFSIDDYIAIYKELESQVGSVELRKRLPEFAIIVQNANDFEGAELRLQAFAKLMGGSADRFESVPNDLKYIFAIVKYCLGEPEPWDLYQKKIEAEKHKRKEAQERKRKQKRQAELAKVTAIPMPTVQASIAPAKIEEKEPTRKLKQTDVPSKKQKALESSDFDSAFGSPVLETPKVEAKRLAAEVLERDSRKLEKKNDKKDKAEKKEPEAPSLTDTSTDATAQINTVPSSTQQQTEVQLSSKTRKLYENLLSAKPQLSTKDALKLLNGFGLSIEAGKGSHTYATLDSDITFDSGEMIKDKKGDIIWICPDFEGNSLSVPRWDGKNIPHYMIKNLKYIISKVLKED